MAGRRRDLVAVAIGSLMLLAVTLYNGYPLAYWDTSSHIGSALTRVIFWARSPAYSVGILPLHLGITLWPVVVAQAVLMAWLLHRVAAAVLGRVDPATYLIILAAMASWTSLPWFVGQVMPDVFVGVALLGLYLLAFGPARGVERAVVLAITCFAVAAHFSHLALVAALTCTLAAASRLPARGAWRPPSLVPILAVPLLGALLIVAANAYCGNRFDVTPPWKTGHAKEHSWQSKAFRGPVLAPYSGILPLIGLLADGPARDYLARDCRDRSYQLCAHLDNMPTDRDQLTWDDESPIYRAGGVEALRSESLVIVMRTLAAYPWRCLRLAADATLRQLATSSIGDGLIPYRETDSGGGRFVPMSIRSHIPGDYHAFLGARQQAGSLPIAELQPVLRGVLAIGSVLSVLALTLAAKRRHGDVLVLGVYLATGIVVHATIVSMGSCVAARFGARIMWLVPFYALLALVWMLRLRRGVAPSAIAR